MATADAFKQQVKRVVPHDWLVHARAVSRLRWGAKYKLARGFAAGASRRTVISYVLLDPELESFSFDLHDEPGTIAALAKALDVPAAELARYADETRADPELGRELARHVRWRPDAKRRMPLGSRLPWYLMVRAKKPELVVETGIYMGLGSLAVLRALARNADDGHPGELMSFDFSRHAGAVVRPELRGSWQRFVGPTSETLAPALDGREVGILFQDTPHTTENQTLEFGLALTHAAPDLLLVDGSGGHATVLEQLCREQGGTYHRTPLRSRDHIYPGADVTFGSFSRNGAG